MKHDLYAMMDCPEDYHRAVADLHPVEENDMPVMRHEGRATTADGWQILVVEDVRQYRPQYKEPDKFWARVGVVWATHLETQQNIPASAVREFNRQIEEAKSARE